MPDRVRLLGGCPCRLTLMTSRSGRALPDRQIAVFEIEFTADDKVTRRRWNGGPMASKEASDALFEAVEAARVVLAKHGYENASAGYGVRAEDVHSHRRLWGGAPSAGAI